MPILGLTHTRNLFHWALLTLERKKPTLLTTGSGLTLPSELLSIKSLTFATGLEDILRRTLTLPLTSKKLLRQSLPFQIEPLLPFPPDQAVISAHFLSSKTETDISLWITSCETIQNHLTYWQHLNIDPHLISCHSLALARWAHFSQLQNPLIILHHNLGVACDSGRVLSALSSQDPHHLKLFLTQKYPTFSLLENTSPFAIPIGLALEAFEKDKLQLRTPSFSSSAQQKQKLQLLSRLSCSLAALLVLAFLSSFLLFSYQKTSLQSQLHSYPLSLQAKAKRAPHSTSPPLQDILTWLSSKTAPVNLHHISYESPDKLILEFHADTPAAASLFLDQLQQKPSLISPTHELKWTNYSQNYKTSFPLK